MKTTFSIVAAVVLAVLLSTSCCCFHRHSSTGLDELTKTADTTIVDTLGDSILSIINASGTATAINRNLSVQGRCDTVVKLKADATEALRFLILNPENYKTNVPVYGVFNPSVCYVFKKGKRRVNVLFDFGLGKWGVMDANGKQLFIRDLRSNDILRLSRTLFPCDTLLESIEKN